MVGQWLATGLLLLTVDFQPPIFNLFTYSRTHACRLDPPYLNVGMMMPRRMTFWHRRKAIRVGMALTTREAMIRGKL